MGIEEIVKVDIVLGTKSVTRAGFGTAMILSAEAPFPDAVRTYKSLKAVAADFATTTSVYKFAQKLFGQELKPKQIKVGKRTALVAQTQVVKILNAVDGGFTVEVNGVAFTHVAAGETIAQIRTALIALINAGAEPVTAANGVAADEILLTADVAGQGFGIVAVTANLQLTTAVANNGVENDLIAADNADKDWYALILTSDLDVDVKAAAAWIETQRKIFGTAQSTAGIIAAGNTDIASFLKGKGYFRTFIMYATDQASGAEAAWFGNCLPRNPGSETWKFKTLVGITADDLLTDTQVGNAQGKNCNLYRTIGGVGVTSEGVVASGEYIDTIRFRDWLQAQIEENVFATLVSVPKIPYTDNGLAVLQNIIDAQLKRGVDAGGLTNDPKPEVVIPKVADIPVLDRQARKVPVIEFYATLAGAVHSMDILGTLTV